MDQKCYIMYKKGLNICEKGQKQGFGPKLLVFSGIFLCGKAENHFGKKSLAE